MFSLDGQRILAASLDDTARVWDLSGQPLATLQGHTSAVLSAVFSPDGQRMLTASSDLLRMFVICNRRNHSNTPK